MYVTRPLSHLLKFPDSVSVHPEGPNSGYLVIQDEESETYSCFGLCKNRTLKDLPFPQNKELTVQYVVSTGQSSSVSLNPVFLIPVLNQPLSCNRYYAIEPHNKHKGMDSALRARLPPLNFPPLGPVVVGKWYCPFIFVKEGSVRNQVERSMYYEMTLEQTWEQVFTCQKNADGNPGNSVLIDVVLEKEVVFIAGEKVMLREKNAVDGVIWFTGSGNKEDEMSLGLRVEVVQRMKWEQERGGWLGGEEREVKIKKIEEFKEGGEWREFRCFVLVERFNLKRMDGSLAMAYDFKHCHQIKTIWE